jgi:hypothetical protein
MENTTEKKTTKAARVALMTVLCLTIFASGVLRSYQAGVESQAKRVMADANNPVTLAALQHQIQTAKLVKR